MIRDGHLTYEFSGNNWLFAEFESTIGNALVIAVLSTVLSYQATAIVFDLLLGLKQKKIAPINLFQVLLLVRRSSPVSVVNSLLRRDWLTGIYFKGYLPERSEISRDIRPIRYSITVRLIILLIAAPLINIIAVVLTFENSIDVTFAQANFGGAVLGIVSNDNSSVTRIKNLTERCEAYPILAQQGDYIEAQFSSCFSLKPPAVRNGNARVDGDALVYVSMVNWRDIVVGLEVGSFMLEFRKVATLDTKSVAAGLRAVVEVSSAERMLDSAVREISDLCEERPDPDDIEDRHDETAASIGQGFIALRRFPCLFNQDDMESLRDILLNMGQQTTLVDSERLLIVNGSRNPTGLEEFDLSDFIDGTSEVLLQRRRRTVSLIFMAGLAAVSIILRLFLAVILNNDVHDGIERLIKERLGIKNCQSLLKHGNFRVQY